MKKLISVFVIAALMISAASCGGSSSSAPSKNFAEKENIIADGAGGYADAAPSEYPSYEASGDRSLDRTDSFIGSDDGYFADRVTEDYYGSDDGYYEQSRVKAGLLTAGEWRDNNNWALWNSILTQRYEWKRSAKKWQLDTLLRYRVKLTANGEPYNGATVKLLKGNNVIWTAVSDSRGTAFLFDTKVKSPDKITVEIGGKVVHEHMIDASEQPVVGLSSEPKEINIDISAAPAAKKKLDLMFVIDTTGSMSDELSYIQNELEDVINRVANDNQIDVRLSVNFYRDIGDDYVIRNFDFTNDIPRAIKDLQAQSADGGGDYPEALPNALEKAVFNHSWGKTDESEKLLFLVLDAPAHEKDADMLPQIMLGAAKTGIRIIPVASSGVDTDTECLCRSFAIMTGGTYTFLTDDSGIGGSHKEPTTGSYTVEKLNDMIVRIIGEYFSSEPYSAVSGNTSGRIEESRETDLSLRCDYFQTSDYYGGSGFYGQTAIRSTNELYGFYDKFGYKEQLADFAYSVDFDSSYIMVEVLCLSSGSVHIDSSRKFAAYDRNGDIVFDYELYTPYIGTEDMSAIFMVAEVPYKNGQRQTDDMIYSGEYDEDDKWLYEMNSVDDAINALLSSDGFDKLSTPEKAKKALALLNGLAENGTNEFPYPLIKKSSIYYGSGDIISFEYSCGVCGGIKLEPFDPMFN